MRRFGSVTAALVLCVSANLFARATPQQRARPVVGLALSGGSALGLAHIGVLRYLEEHRIPVDRIAGTSMGGLLGGLYATGHSAADLEKIVQEGDWDQLLRSTSPYEDRSVSEKQEWNRITGPYSIPLRSSLSLPSGINSGQSLVQLLSGETAAYWDVSSFDDLPIPFRCVATDFLSGEAFILRDGRLPRALRATMAIPGVFTPVDWNGRLLGDGGLVNNLPTDVAKDMGSDVVIGVTLRVAPANVLELRTLTDIVRQTINIAVTQSEEKNRALADIEITVDLGNRNSLSFQETKVIIDAGYAAASMNQAALQKLSVSPEEWAAYRQQKESRRRSIPASGKVARVTADDAGIAKSAARELNRKVGDGVSAKNLEPLLTRLTSTASLPNAYFGWRSQPTPAGYDIEIEERRSTEFMLRPSFFYQYSVNEPGRPTLRIAGSAIPGSAYKSRFVGALFVGPSPGISVEYYHPFDGSNFFVAPGITFERTRFYQYIGDDERQDHSRVRSAASIYGGIGTWRQLQFRVGAKGGYDRYSDPMIAFGPPASNTGFVNPEVVGILNTQDSGMLPTRGSRVNGSAGYSFRKHSFPYLELDFDHFHPLTQDISLVAMGKTNTSMGRSLTFYDQFSVGGFRELDAFRYQEFRGKTVLLGSLGLIHRGMNPKNVAFRPIWGAWYEAGTIDTVSTGWDSQRSATAGVFTPTPLGLLGLTVGTNFDGATRWRISIGSFWNRP